MPNRAFVTKSASLTFADIITIIEAMDELTKTRRRDLISVLRTMTRFLSKEPSAIPANTEWLRQFHPKQANISEKHFANVKSAVMAAIKTAGVRNKRVHSLPNMNPRFQDLYDAIPDRMLGYKLSRFFRAWASQESTILFSAPASAV